MTTLKCVKKTVLCVDWATWSSMRERGELGLEEYLSEKLGKPVEGIDSSNDTTYEFSVKPRGPEDFKYDYQRQDFERMMGGKVVTVSFAWNPSVSILLDYACKQGWIEEGVYIVSISW